MRLHLNSDERDFARYRSRGDARALGHVFDRNAPALLGLARHLAPDTASAEDLVQATFLTAMEKRATWDDARPLAPWLAGILGHHAREARRRAGRPLDAARLLEERDEAQLAEDPARHLEQEERGAACAALLAGLPSNDAAVLVPHLVEGRPAAETAARLGISVGAVHVRVHRALRRLARRLPPALAPAAAATLVLQDDARARGLAALRSDLLGRVETGVRAGTRPAVRAALPAAVGAFACVALGVMAARPAAPAAAPAAPVLAGATPGVRQATTLVAVDPPVGRALLAGDRDGEASAAAPGGPWRIAVLAHSTRESGRLAGASAWLREAGATSGSARLLARAERDARGTPRLSFELEDADLGRLEVRAPGHVAWRAPAASRFLRARLHGDLTRDDGARRATLSLTLRPARTVEGRVVDASGHPVAGAELFVVGTTPGFAVPDCDAARARSGADGRFVLDDLVPLTDIEGLALVAAVADGRRPALLGWRLLDEPTDGRTEVEVQLGLAHAVAVTVLDAQGAPVVGAKVAATPCGGPWRRRSDPELTERLGVRWPAAWRAALEATTDASGVAHFDGLPLLPHGELGLHDGAGIRVGDVELGCFELRSADEEWLTVEDSRAYAPLPSRRAGALVPAASLDAWTAARDALAPRALILEPARWVEVRGRALDAEGRPVAGASAHWDAGHRVVRAGPDGSFLVPRTRADRVAKLEVRAAGYLDAEVAVSPAPGGAPLELDVALRRDLPFVLRVDEESFGGERWRVGFARDGWTSGSFSFPRGEFEVTGAPDGPLTVTLFLDGAHEPVARGDFENDGRPVRLRRAGATLVVSDD